MQISRHLPRLVLFLLFACAATGFAQSSPYKPGAPLLMWKISTPNGAKVKAAYVLGSVHLGDSSLYPLPAVIEDAFQASNVLLVEVDLRKISPLQTQAMMAASGSYPPGDDLFKHITPETRQKLDAFLAKYGLPPQLFLHMRPWILGTAIQMLPIVKEGANPAQGIDSYFLNKAGNKRVEQVESAESQIKLLSQMPESISDAWISSAIREAEDSNDRWAKLETDWKEGAADKLDALEESASMNETAGQKAFERSLREDRNPHMADRLEQCMQSGEACFMVVGAAHVVGSEGIVQLMRQRGYRVEQAVVGKDANLPAGKPSSANPAPASAN